MNNNTTTQGSLDGMTPADTCWMDNCLLVRNPIQEQDCCQCCDLVSTKPHFTDMFLLESYYLLTCKQKKRKAHNCFVTSSRDDAQLLILHDIPTLKCKPSIICLVNEGRKRKTTLLQLISPVIPLRLNFHNWAITEGYNNCILQGSNDEGITLHVLCWFRAQVVLAVSIH